METLSVYSFNSSDKLELEKISDILKSEVSQNIGDKAMTLAERLIEQGKAKGIALGEKRGEEIGRLKSLQNTLLRMLEKKFYASAQFEKTISSILRVSIGRSWCFSFFNRFLKSLTLSKVSGYHFGVG
jgi:predicted transposase YdaD